MGWQAWLGPAVGVVGLVFAVFTYLRNRKPKRLQYRVVVDEEIIATNQAHTWTDLSVRFEGRALVRPRVVVAQVLNTGKVEARPEDFEQPITVEVDSGDRIVAAAISVCRPGVKGRKEAEIVRYVDAAAGSSSQVIAPKLLLNEEEILEFRLLLEDLTRGRSPAYLTRHRRRLGLYEGWDEPVTFSARIAGFSFSPYTARRAMPSLPLPLRYLLVPVVIVIFSLGIAFGVVAISSGTVPPVEGAQVDEAVQRLNDEGLTVGPVSRIRSDRPVGEVLSSSPSEGAAVGSEEVVSLIISDGP